MRPSAAIHRLPMPYSVPALFGMRAVPPWGQVTLTQASVGALASWTPLRCGYSAGYITEDNTPANSHLLQIVPTNTARGPATFSVTLGPVERTWAWISLAQGVDPYAWFNLATGAIGVKTAGATASAVAIGGGLYRCTLSYDDCFSNNVIFVGMSTGNAVSSYNGDGASRIYAADPVLTQTRVSALGDVQPVRTFPPGKTVAYNYTEAAAASQAFFQLVNGIRNELWNPGATAKDLVEASAEMFGFLSNMAPFTVMAAWRLDAGAAADQMQPWRHAAAGAYYLLGSNATQKHQITWHDGTNPDVFLAAPSASANLVVDVVTFDGANLRLYQNGALVAGPTAVVSLNKTVIQAVMYIRQGGFCEHDPWNRALSLDEIRYQTFGARRRFAA